MVEKILYSVDPHDSAPDFQLVENSSASTEPAKILPFPNIEKPVGNEVEYSNARTLILQAGSSHPFAANIERYRRDYVTKMGWMPEGRVTDLDRYDELGRETLTYVELLEDENGEDFLLSHLRLSRVQSLDDCLSFEMVKLDIESELDDSRRQEFSMLAETGDLYDLTRLLPSSKIVPNSEYFASVVRLIGCGVRNTTRRPGSNPTWIYATTPGMHAMLNRMGIINDKLKVTVPTPEHSKAILCSINALGSLQLVTDNPKYDFTYQQVTKGIETAGLTSID